MLGALLGGLADSWAGTRVDNIPLSELVLPALGAAAALIPWAAAQRTLLAPQVTEKSKDAA
jgi:hypothetical protein